MTKKVANIFEGKIGVTPSVAAPDDTNPSDVTLHMTGDRSVNARKYLPLVMWSIFKILASQAGLIALLPFSHSPL